VSDRSCWTNFPVVVTPICAGTPSHTRESTAVIGTSRFGASQRLSDHSDPIISDRIFTSVSMCQSQAPMPLNYNPISDHQYSVYASVAHPQPPCQYPLVTVVAGSSAVNPTAQRSYPIPVGSASVNLTRPDNIVVDRSNGYCVSGQSKSKVK